MCLWRICHKAQKKAGSTELSTKRREIFFKKEIDRLIEKIAKNKEKKQEIFIRRDRRAFDWKKNNCLLSISSSSFLLSNKLITLQEDDENSSSNKNNNNKEKEEEHDDGDE